MPTPDEVLLNLWERAESVDADDAILGVATTAEWPVGLLEALQSSGVIEEIEPAITVRCDGCEDAHWPEVVLPLPGRGIVGLGHYYCRASGWEEVALDDLRQWRVSLPGIAVALASAIGTDRPPREEVAQRLWSLGRTDTNHGLRQVFLARVGDKAGAPTLAMQRILEHSAIPPIVFTFTHHLDGTHWANALVVALRDIAIWRHPRLTLDLRALGLNDSKPEVRQDAKRTRGRLRHLKREDIEQAYVAGIERDVDGNIAWPTQDDLADKLGVSAVTLRRELKRRQMPWPPVPPGFLPKLSTD